MPRAVRKDQVPALLEILLGGEGGCSSSGCAPVDQNNAIPVSPLGHVHLVVVTHYEVLSRSDDSGGEGQSGWPTVPRTMAIGLSGSLPLQATCWSGRTRTRSAPNRS